MNIECDSCHKNTKVRDIELIIKKFGGWYCNTDEEYHYNMTKIWVCPHCTEPQYSPSDKDGIFSKENPYSNGFDHYVKSVYEWYSDRERCHGRVLQLLGPHIKRVEENRAKHEKERKI